MIKKSLLTAAIALGTVSTNVPAAMADVLDSIKEKGTITIGVRADYRPYGYLNPEGENVGLEPDLAHDVAERLGVDVEFVPVQASNRMEFLQQGRIDLLIATMTDTAERRNAVNILQPNHYSSGTNLLARKNVGINTWEDLDGRPICAIQGAFYNRKTQEEFGAELIGFTGTAEVLNALEQGNCHGFVYDDAFIAARLTEPEWADYEMPVETIDDSPWGVATAKGEDALAEVISDIITDWHRTGYIIELEEANGIDPIPFTQRMHEEYKDK